MIAGEDASMMGLSHRETYGTPTPVASYPFMGRSGDPFMPPFGDPCMGRSRTPCMGCFMGALCPGSSCLYS
ncbi:hypothetical protein HMPREF1556_01987 [Porphyromonas sp. oral taxon 278 str. W7784]|nr:hypothetical protein HMPREF1556_01987 [Porphyromonas sp. oral taxon 278 str. W7784]